MIKNLLSYRINVIFPKNMDIAGILNNIYVQITRLINKHYTNFPIWVNKDLFIIHFKKRIYSYLAYTLTEFIENYYDYETSSIESFIMSRANPNDRQVDLYLPKSIIAHAFISELYDLDEEHVDINDITIHLSTDFMDYIIYGVINAQEKYDNYHELCRVIDKLLFVND